MSGHTTTGETRGECLKSKIHLPYDLAFPPLGTQLGKMKAHVHTRTVRKCLWELYPQTVDDPNIHQQLSG